MSRFCPTAENQAYKKQALIVVRISPSNMVGDILLRAVDWIAEQIQLATASTTTATTTTTSTTTTTTTATTTASLHCD